jgi:hypothetical protein
LPLGAYTTFRGQAVDDTSMLIAYTRTADANLDGIVNNDDVATVGVNYAPGSAKPAGSAWSLGDFDYSGFVDNDDITLLGAFYVQVAAPPPPPLTDNRVMQAESAASESAQSDAGSKLVATEELAPPTLQSVRQMPTTVRSDRTSAERLYASELAVAQQSFFESLMHSSDLTSRARRKQIATGFLGLIDDAAQGLI